MKTTTILMALLKAGDRIEQGHYDKLEQLKRQEEKFSAALLSRIEAGDRARAKLREIDKLMEVANTNYHGFYMDLDEIISGESD